MHLQPHLLHLSLNFESLLGGLLQHFCFLCEVHLGFLESLGFEPSSKVGWSVGVIVGLNVGVKVCGDMSVM